MTKWKGVGYFSQYFSKEKCLVFPWPDNFSFHCRGRIRKKLYLHTECFPLAFELRSYFFERRLVGERNSNSKRAKLSASGKTKRIKFFPRKQARFPGTFC